MTFTQEDVDNMKGFLKFVADKAKFDGVDWADAVMLSKYNNFLVGHVRSMQGSVMELTKMIEPEPAKKKTNKKKAK